MHENLNLLFAFTAGLFLGTFFFGGLWFTVKKAATTKSPAALFLGSFLLRVGITMLGFYGIAAGSVQRMLICVAGFIIARFVVIYLTKSIDEKQTQ